MRIKIVSWNLNLWSKLPFEQRTRYLQRLDADVLLLQELRRHEFRQITTAGFLPFGVLSTDIHPRQGGGRWGCAVVTRFPIEHAERITDFDLPDAEDLGLPSRTAVARLRLDDGAPLTVCSFHARPAAGRHGLHAKKPAFHVGVARWLDRQPSPLVFGIDANTPAQESTDPRTTRFCWPTPEGGGWGEDQLLGPDIKGRSDAFRRHIAQTPGLAERLAAQRPDGPLAISHLVRPTNRPVRYDHLWVTDDIEVVRVRYLHRSAIRAGSDHAAVVAVLETPTSVARAA